MPIDDGNQTISKKREQVMLLIAIDCNGTANVVREVRRLRRPRGRDAQGTIVFEGDEEASSFPFAALPGPIKTAIQNLVDTIDMH